MVCENETLVTQNPKYKALKESKTGKTYKDSFLISALHFYRVHRKNTLGIEIDDDWYPETPAERGAFTKFMRNTLPQMRLSQTTSDLTKDSLYNLYSTLYSLYEAPEILSYRIEMLSNDFRKEVDALENADGANRTRQELISAQGDGKNNGFKVIMSRIFERYQKTWCDPDWIYKTGTQGRTIPQEAEARLRFTAERIAGEFEKVLENKERLSALASIRIAADEGLFVSSSGLNIEFEEFDGEEIVTDDPDNPNAKREVDGEEATKGERYADYRTIKLMSTLSPELKRFLNTIPRVNAKGEFVRDDIGQTRYIGARQGAIILQKVLLNSTPDSMMGDLRNAVSTYPWLGALVSRLEKDTDKQALVYAGLKSQETKFFYIGIENGRYKARLANSRSQGRAIEEEAANNLQEGTTLDEDYSIVTSIGNLVSKERQQEIIDKVTPVFSLVRDVTRKLYMWESAPKATTSDINRIIASCTEKYGKDFSFLRESPAVAMDLFLKAFPEVPRVIAAALRGIGYDVTENDIIATAKQPIGAAGMKFLTNEYTKRDGSNKLFLLVDAIDGVYGAMAQGINQTGRALYNTCDSFKYITNSLALSKYDDTQVRVVNDGKVLNTNNPVSLLRQVFHRLANKDGRTEEQYQADIKNEFLQYEGMSLGYGKDMQSTGWLKYLAENPGGQYRQYFEVFDNVGSNHVEYAKMTRAQKLTACLVSWFDSIGYSQRADWGLVEVPIQSDYGSAFNFINVPRLDRETIRENLVDEVLIELQRISAIKRRTLKTIRKDGQVINNPNYDPNRAKLSLYEKRGVKFQIFPHLNKTDFLREAASVAENDAAGLRSLARKYVDAEMERIIQEDYKTVTKSGILTNYMLSRIGNKDYPTALYVKDGDASKLSDDNKARLENWFENVFYARQQIAKLVTGGLENFNGTIDYEKRAMMMHAPHTSLYTKATWDGKPVGRESQNVLYMDDDVTSSYFIKEIKGSLTLLKDRGYITKRQYERMIDSYSKIKATDGQAYRTLSSYREVMIMSGQWSERLENAYKRIENGEPLKSDIDLFIAEIKPVYTGFETIPAANSFDGKQKPVRIPVLHKYSETVLLPLALSEHCLKMKSVPLQAMQDAADRLGKGNRLDLFIFNSGVKVGYHSALKPFSKWKDIKADPDIDGDTDEDARKRHGWKGEDLNERVLNRKEDISDYIVSSVRENRFAIHTLSYTGYGIASSKPVKVVNERNHIVSQAEKQLWGNITEDDKILFRGEEKDAVWARNKYYEIKAADIVTAYSLLRDMFNNPDELERILESELENKPYVSGELKFALSHLKDGKFALPLYSPNVEHQVIQLFSSIIKKRMTRTAIKGANLLQSSSLGMDMEVSTFDDENALSKDELLGIKYDEKTGKPKWVEVALPIYDERLKKFADENGEINAKRLEELVQTGFIDEKILKFMAYRTPSDAEHSIIPCKVKYFISAVGGTTIRMPRELMSMTGHDYDGDTMHCHFPEFREGYNETALRNAYSEYISAEGAEENIDYETYRKRKISALRKAMSPEFKSLKYIEYDYSDSAVNNDSKARNNGKLELMFAKATSEFGFSMMMIPGTNDDTKIIAKSFQISRLASNPENATVISEELSKKGVLAENIARYMNDTVALQKFLLDQSDGYLQDILDALNDGDSPFTMTHSMDAFDYIMGGASMIDVYALYSSAFQMFQRLDLKYKPVLNKKGQPYVVKFFGNELGKICDIRTHGKNNKPGILRSLTSSHMLTSAVDNGKDPILGYINQTPAIANISVFFDAAGLDELQMHLIMNQPAMVELAKRLSGRDSRGFITEAQGIINELSSNATQDISALDPKGFRSAQGNSIKLLGDLQEEDYMENIPISYDSLLYESSDKLTAIRMQIALLQTLIHINPAIERLSDIVRVTRPESNAGGLGGSVESLIIKLDTLEKLRYDINTRPDKQCDIEGILDVLSPRDVNEWYEPEILMEKTQSPLHEVTAQNTLMLEDSMSLFEKYFVEAKHSWRKLAAQIAEMYRYQNLQEGVLRRVFREMILYKMLSNKKFAQGDVTEEQKRIVINTPYWVGVLKRAVGEAQKKYDKDEEMTGNDWRLRELGNNVFLAGMTATSPEDSKVAPRLMFKGNNMEADGSIDAMRAGWNQLLMSYAEITDPKNKDNKISVEQLAKDLFLYNLYTNGLSFGMYEFSHLAPFSVLAQVPYYIEAMHDLMRDDWDDDETVERFIGWYLRNHWGDDRLLRSYPVSKLKLEKTEDGTVYLSTKNKDNLIDEIKSQRLITTYSVIESKGKKERVDALWSVEVGKNNTVILRPAMKQGSKNNHGQVGLHYDPSKSGDDVPPIFPGNDSIWGVIDKELDPYAESNYSDEAGMNEHIRRYGKANNVKIDYAERIRKKIDERLYGESQTIREIEEKATPAVEHNDRIDVEEPHEQESEVVVSSEESVSEQTDYSASSEEDEEKAQAVPAKYLEMMRKAKEQRLYGKQYSIARREEDGTITVESVPATPTNVQLARKQKVFVELNKRLRPLLEKVGIAVGTLTDAEALMSLNGVTDFDTAIVTAEGLLELIRIANNVYGEQALPEEFAHVALEMLGHDNPLVQRLLKVLSENEQALEEASDGQYADYLKAYEGDRERMILEAAGKLVAKHLFLQQEIETRPIRSLLQRICDAIKNLFRKIFYDDVKNAILEAEGAASSLAKGLLGGKLLDDKSYRDLNIDGKLYAVQRNISDRKDVVANILKNVLKRRDLLRNRLFAARTDIQSEALMETEAMIMQLEKQLDNAKAESAIISYFNNSVNYLRRANASLDKVVGLDTTGREKANSVGKKLMVVRDTIAEVASSIEAVDEAIKNGEMQDTADLKAARDAVSSVLRDMVLKCDKLGLEYLEAMLSGTYGTEGLTVTIGKDKGRKISIHDMATMADQDITVMSRWFNALSDADDFVLLSIDDWVKNAKRTARGHLDKLTNQLIAAFETLVKETGSRDQSFMFQKRRFDGGKWCNGLEDDGKLHKTGFYIRKDSKAYEKLSDAQKNYYKAFMALKAEVDRCVPEQMVKEGQIINIRKDFLEKYAGTSGLKDKTSLLWDSIRDKFVDNSDDLDFENESVSVDFDGNKIDRLPLKFLYKGKNETYDAMTDDAASSLLAYAGMAFEYNALNGVIGIIENAKYMSAKRDVVQKTGWRTRKQFIGTKEDTTIYSTPFTVKQARTRIQEMMNDYFLMHVYGHIQKDEGTFGHTRVSKRKTANTLLGATSLSQMAFNLTQRITNISTGQVQIVIDALGGEDYKLKDVLWATEQYLKYTPDRIKDLGADESDNYLSLFLEKFDVHQNNRRNGKKLGKGKLSRAANTSWLYLGLRAGEDYLAGVTALAIAHAHKVRAKDGSETNLFDAYTIKYADPQNKRGAYLELKDGYTQPDMKAITAEYEAAYEKLVVRTNFDNQGIYNLDDRSAVEQYILGSLVIMYRKWIAPSIKRRYAKVRYDKMRDKFTEGFHRTAARFLIDSVRDAKDAVTEEASAAALLNIYTDIKAFVTAVKLNWENLTPYEQANIRKSLTELSSFVGIWLSIALLSRLRDLDDDDELSWWDNQVLVQLLRLRTEIGSQAPTPILVNEAGKLIRSPMASLGTIQDALNGLRLLIPSNYWSEIKSGRYKGHTKAYKYFRELPVISMFKKVDNFVDPSPLINYYQNDSVL